jgi:hypothetical protein
MIDSLKVIADSVSKLTQHTAKDTIYVINVNNESEFLKILPILITGLALIFTAYSIIISRRSLITNNQHQKLSVQPLLTIYEEFTLRDRDGIGVQLKSCGLGPAIIQKYELLWNGNPINDTLINTICGSLNIGKIEVDEVFGERLIEKDNIKWILRIPLTELPQDDNNFIRSNEILEIVKRSLSIDIVYISIYRKKNSELSLRYPIVNT